MTDYASKCACTCIKKSMENMILLLAKIFLKLLSLLKEAFDNLQRCRGSGHDGDYLIRFYHGAFLGRSSIMDFSHGGV